MKLSIRIVRSDGQTMTATTGFADLIALEERFGIKQSDFTPKPVIGADGKQAIAADGTPLEEMTISATWLSFLAWNSLRRKKETSDSFEVFNDTIEELGFGEDDDSGN